MKTQFRFSFLDADARQHLPLDLGKDLGNTREISALSGDEAYEYVRTANAAINALRGGQHCGWSYIREYADDELQKAELFHMRYPREGRPILASNQEVYDWSGVCAHCGAGRKQVQPLEINVKRLPKSRPLLCTIGSEWLVTESVADGFVRQRFTGFELRPLVRDDKALSDEPSYAPYPQDIGRYASGRELLQRAKALGLSERELDYGWLDSKPNRQLWAQCVEEHNEWVCLQKGPRALKAVRPWYQLVVTSNPIATCPPTRFGIGPFDEDVEGRYRCALRHTSGLHILSEVHVRRGDWNGSDLVATSNLIGQRGGYLVPEPMLLVSPRLRQFLVAQKPRGVVFEVAHLI